jgi:hypothetical protein
MLDLHALHDLPTTAPILLHENDHGVLSLAVRVTGTYAARRLRALYEVAHLPSFHPEHHATHVTYHTGHDAWMLTANGNAGRVQWTDQTLTLDDGFGHVLTQLRLPPAQGRRGSRQLALALAARFLHTERAQEQACRVCGCNASWPCENGCTPVTNGECSACAALASLPGA